MPNKKKQKAEGDSAGKEPKKTKQEENAGKSAKQKKAETQAKRAADKDKKTGFKAEVDPQYENLKMYPQESQSLMSPHRVEPYNPAPVAKTMYPKYQYENLKIYPQESQPLISYFPHRILKRKLTGQDWRVSK
eukprot:GFUD01115382.1.p1 GENE.GFUD01115382.1~~GFUD01115382.1.p1  ORF type:complete len:133 (+),score=45.66 GFUD01115382.1:62-460(+)